jgi:mono/diheme cytochrome c family protein
MPDFRLTDREALALTEYLRTLRDGLPDPPAALRYRGTPKPDNVAAGQKLTGKDYFGCYQCHILGARRPDGKPEDWAPDLERIRDRFLPDFFLKWFADPSRYRPGTKMPGFFPDKDAGPEDILGGDEPQQMAALRDYLFSLGQVQVDPGYQRASKAYPDVRPAEGRSLMIRLNCVGCHEVASLPNGKRVGPSLAHQGSRVRRAWLVAFLRDPGVIKPEYDLMVGGAGQGARMPSFSLTADEAAAIADFMQTVLVAPEATDPFKDAAPSAALMRRGEQLFSVKFCHNCHRVQQRPGGIGPDLTHAGRRLQPGWTVSFIQRPSHYLDTRMPNLKVNADEAQALAAYILGEKR